MTYTADELKQMRSATNWDAVDALTDDELTRAALSDPDNPPLDEETVSRCAWQLGQRGAGLDQSRGL